MPRVPITVMGYRCERCSHEWIPRDTHTRSCGLSEMQKPLLGSPQEKGGSDVDV